MYVPQKSQQETPNFKLGNPALQAGEPDFAL
jgi:hypothetical protein